LFNGDENNGEINLNRAMLCGAYDVKHELNLDAFDHQMRNALFDVSDAQMVDE